MAADRVIAQSMIEPENENRDPNNINMHSVVTFYEVLGEPKEGGVRSPNWLWPYLNATFDYTLRYSYVFISAIFSVLLAIIWGLKFALLSFVHIWFVTPTLEMIHINILAGQRVVRMLVHCMMDPLYESMGLAFSRIRIATGDAAQI